jgi:hypothetical protein
MMIDGMSSKQYLSQAYRAGQEIRADVSQLIALQTMSLMLGSAQDGDRVQTSGNHDRMGDAAAAIVDLRDKIGAEIERYLAIRAEVSGVIAQVEDGAQRDILKMRYLGGERWQAIADGLNITPRHVFRIHGAALRAVDKIRQGIYLDHNLTVV